jgi:hypothetical protein
MGLNLWDTLLLKVPVDMVTAEDSRLPTSSGLNLRLLKTSTTVLEVTRAERRASVKVGGPVIFLLLLVGLTDLSMIFLLSALCSFGECGNVGQSGECKMTRWGICCGFLSSFGVTHLSRSVPIALLFLASTGRLFSSAILAWDIWDVVLFGRIYLSHGSELFDFSSAVSSFPALDTNLHAFADSFVGQTKNLC